MKILKESFFIDTSEPGFIHVEHVQLSGSGVDMGSPMWFECANLRWVIDTLRACATTYAFPETNHQSGQDSLSVDESGPEQAPFINLYNRRPNDAPHGGAFVLAMSKPVSERLIDELDALGQKMSV
jgi:hypothetical protein